MALPEIDYMEYASDAAAQAAYVSSDTTKAFQVDTDGTLTTNLQEYYKLEDTTGFFSAIDLTNNNAASFNTGKINNAVDFGANNSNKSLSTTNAMGIDGGVMSIAGWVNVTTAPGTDANVIMLWQSNSTSQVEYNIRYADEDGTKKLWFIRGRSGVANDAAKYTVTLTTGTWYHLVLWYDGTNVKGYLNGSEVASASSSGNGTTGTSSGVSLGVHLVTSAGAFSGLVDEVGIWDKALSTTEITDLYNSGTGQTMLHHLQSYSESTIKQQGSYSLKGFAKITESLNDTLTRTIVSPIDLSGINTITFDIYASRTGANIKLGIHDSGGTTTEKTHTISTADTWETASWDISGVADADKDVIDSIIITATNADADNTFYIDNFIAAVTLSVSVSDALGLAESIGGKGGDLPSSVSDAVTLAESILMMVSENIDVSDAITITETILAKLPDALKMNVVDSITLAESITASLPDALKMDTSDALAIAESIKLKLTSFVNVSESISIAENIIASLPDALKATATDAISVSESIKAAISACVLSATEDISIAEAVELIIPFYLASVSDAISVAESISVWFPYYDIYSFDLFVDQVKSLDLFVKTTKTLDMYIDQVKSFTMEH